MRALFLSGLMLLTSCGKHEVGTQFLQLVEKVGQTPRNIAREILGIKDNKETVIVEKETIIHEVPTQVSESDCSVSLNSVGYLIDCGDNSVLIAYNSLVNRFEFNSAYLVGGTRQYAYSGKIPFTGQLTIPQTIDLSSYSQQGSSTGGHITIRINGMNYCYQHISGQTINTYQFRGIRSSGCVGSGVDSVPSRELEVLKDQQIDVIFHSPQLPNNTIFTVEFGFLIQ